ICHRGSCRSLADQRTARRRAMEFVEGLARPLPAGGQEHRHSWDHMTYIGPVPRFSPQLVAVTAGLLPTAVCTRSVADVLAGGARSLYSQLASWSEVRLRAPHACVRRRSQIHLTRFPSFCHLTV